MRKEKQGDWEQGQLGAGAACQSSWRQGAPQAREEAAALMVPKDLDPLVHGASAASHPRMAGNGDCQDRDLQSRKLWNEALKDAKVF